MKYTLLELVQSILSAMESDQVDSINETQEAYDIAVGLRDLFYDISSDLSLAEQQTLLELDASGDTDQPTLMTVPDTVTSIDWIKYDNKLATETNSNFLPVTFLPFNEFLEMQTSLRTDSTTAGQMTVIIGTESFQFMYRSDKHPQYYTVIDDHNILFDSYDSSVDDTLQKSKTMCMGKKSPPFTLTDTFVPNLNPQQFSYFLNRAKARLFVEKKQLDHKEASAEARRQKIVIQKKGQIVSEGGPYTQLQHFGRRPKK